MPTEITESFESRKTTVGDNPTHERIYDVGGTTDDVAVKALVAASSPTTYAGLTRLGFTIEPNGSADEWRAVVNYGIKPTEEGVIWSMSTTGGTAHITQSLETIARKAASGDAPNHFGAIGFDGERVEGTDIGVAEFNLTAKKKIAAETFTTAYAFNLYRQAYTTNHAAWNGFAAGEVLFKGHTADQTGEGDWDVTFYFAANPNVTGLSFGPITGVDKKGWEYIWVRYEDAVDDDAFVKKPVGVYVERVYGSSNFSLLGLVA